MRTIWHSFHGTHFMVLRSDNLAQLWNLWGIHERADKEIGQLHSVVNYTPILFCLHSSLRATFPGTWFLWLYTHPSLFHSYVTFKWLHYQKNQSNNMYALCSRHPSWRILAYRNIIIANDIIQKNIRCSIFIMMRKEKQYKCPQIEKWINKPILWHCKECSRSACSDEESCTS